MIQNLPGFRDFLPADCARRNYVTSTWRTVARRYGFQEYDGPVLESAELYEKKNSGGEILQQLYQFEDRGGRRVSLRPEMTPTLARIVADKHSHFRKPLKWFSISNFFRYERKQKGRLREFLQLNADIIGEASVAADAELIALCVDVLRGLGFEAGDFVVRLSDRRPWLRFLEARGVHQAKAGDFLAVIDKLEREPESVSKEKLEPFGVRLEEVREFLRGGGDGAFEPLLADLATRGMRDFVEADLGIVRGLAYYTGIVFEVFDRSKSLRAIAGGGRYDGLLASISDGATDLPAAGFGMGDVVLGHFIEASAAAKARMETEIREQSALDVYLVIADEARRPEALELVTALRRNGWRVDLPLNPAKVAKQFQAAEQTGARCAVLIGAEWPRVRLKELATRQETELAVSQLEETLNATPPSL